MKMELPIGGLELSFLDALPGSITTLNKHNVTVAQRFAL